MIKPIEEIYSTLNTKFDTTSGEFVFIRDEVLESELIWILQITNTYKGYFVYDTYDVDTEEYYSGL